MCAVWAARAVGAVGAARAEYGSIWGGCEEGMWAVGVVGTFLWVVNAVKAQNQAEQEGAPPDAEPGGRRIMLCKEHIRVYEEYIRACTEYIMVLSKIVLYLLQDGCALIRTWLQPSKQTDVL